MPPGRWYGHFVVQVVIISGPIPFEGLVAGVMPLHTGELRAGLGCRLLAGAVFGLTVGTNALAWLGQSAGADRATPMARRTACSAMIVTGLTRERPAFPQ